jgi:starvation-inducible DNA-binding protein
MSEIRDTRIEIPEEAREGLVDLLNSHFADPTDLYTQVKFAHWNVKGSDFIQLHELFDEIAAHGLEITDLIAERATTLGGDANGTLRQAAAGSSLDEYPQVGAYAASTRQAIEESDKLGDAASSDLFTAVARQIDKDLWFLEAHLQSTN